MRQGDRETRIHAGGITKMKYLVWVLALMLFTSCVALPAPVPERSILTLPASANKIYLPIMPNNPSLGKGVGLTYGNCEDISQLDAAWYINWGTQSSGCTNATHIPVVWGDFKTCPITGPGPLTLGFNEPQLKEQANLTPDAAAILWHKLTVECAPERQWGTPSAINDLYWLTDWYHAYVTLYGAPPRADLVNVHCYSWSGADACIAYLKQVQIWARARSIPGIIISEWAVLPCSNGQAWAFAEADRVRTWIETQLDIVGAAWFAARIRGDEWWAIQPQPACNTALVDGAGQLTAWGWWYADQ